MYSVTTTAWTVLALFFFSSFFLFFFLPFLSLFQLGHFCKGLHGQWLGFHSIRQLYIHGVADSGGVIIEGSNGSWLYHV